jgi:geranylgeranyl diphosphate synthase type II
VLAVYKKEFLEYLEKKIEVKEPKNLYEPIKYILGLGGKKIRPILTLLAADAFGIDYKKALDAALSVEVFHNFTLIHDDIMDDAPLRRGNITVHEKWDTNIGILSGDAMLIQAYQYLEGYDSDTFKRLMKLLSKTALEVCEGQQMDVDFEDRNDVVIEEYITMIEFKTSVLVAGALKMGAIVANVDEVEANKIYEFGLNLGLAFQLQDDYLDAFGNPETFGKQIGGDIIENKKTFLYLTALNNSNKEEREILETLYSKKLNENQEKIEKVKGIFLSSLAADETIKLINQYTQKSFEVLDTISIKKDKKQLLIDFGNTLMNRKV